MQGYSRQRYERPVEYGTYGYEDDGYGYEEEGDEYEDDEEEEELEEEARKPTKEAMEYLELRQRLKERVRREKMKKEGGSRSSGERRRLPYDNFGSFFGPPQPVIAERVIQESKSLLENQHLASRVTNSVHHNNKSYGSTSSGSKPVAHTQKPKVIDEQKLKVQKRKDTRDYSFLLSDDAELPAPSKDRPPRSASAPKSEVRSSQSVVKSKHPSASNGRPVHGSRENGGPVQGSRDIGRPAQGSRDNGRPAQGSRDNGRSAQGSRDNGRPAQGVRDNGRPVQDSRESGRPVHRSRDDGRSSGRDERKAAPTNGQIHSKVASNRPSSASSRPGSTSMDSRKQLGSHIANGPGRPLGPKGLPSKIPASTSERASAPGLKNSKSSVQRTSLKSESSLLKQPVQQRKDVREPYKPTILSKQSRGLPKHQIQKPQMHKQIPPRPMTQEYRPKKRPASGFAHDEYDPEDISREIRSLFRYNPRAYDDDDDSSDMEAGFEDIQREERRSAKIARQEDEEQARLIEEEERRERMAAKMRKKRRFER